MHRGVAITFPVQNLKDPPVLDCERIDTAREKFVGLHLAPDRDLRYKDRQEALHIGEPKRLQSSRCELGWNREQPAHGVDGKKLVEKALGPNGNIAVGRELACQ